MYSSVVLSIFTVLCNKFPEFFILQNWNSVSNNTFSFAPPPRSWQPHSAFCFHEFDYSFTHLCSVAQLLSLTLCVSVDYRLSGSSVHGFSRQEYWSGLPIPSPGHLPNPGIKPVSLMSHALADRFFYPCATYFRYLIFYSICLLWLAYFTKHIVFKVHPCRSMWLNVPTF